MVTIKKINTEVKQEVNQFVNFPFGLYRDVAAWVPPITADIKTMLNKNKHPFYEHSEADFFVAEENGNHILYTPIQCLLFFNQEVVGSIWINPVFGPPVIPNPLIINLKICWVIHRCAGIPDGIPVPFQGNVH